ncbi:MAG: nitrite/sulfite reductase, partial [Myxococcota bacterium]
LGPQGEGIRLVIDQNIVLPWIPGDRLGDVFRGLQAARLTDEAANVLYDITACPGTDTCKLGIASSRGLAGELRRVILGSGLAEERALRPLQIKVSGCFNSCGQHHVADLGFYGVSRKADGFAVPHFQVVLGGRRSHNGDTYGLAIGAIPSRQVPDMTAALLAKYKDEREDGEDFRDYIGRWGKSAVKQWLSAFRDIPAFDDDDSYYRDWGDSRTFSLGDRGVGECAGQAVSSTALGIAQAESIAFQAQLQLDEGQAVEAGRLALESMVQAARALLQAKNIGFTVDSTEVVPAFKTHFIDTELFFDPHAKGKFAAYLLRQAKGGPPEDTAAARQSVEEAQLFIEASHACSARL